MAWSHCMDAFSAQLMQHEPRSQRMRRITTQEGMGYVPRLTAAAAERLACTAISGRCRLSDTATSDVSRYPDARATARPLSRQELPYHEHCKCPTRSSPLHACTERSRICKMPPLRWNRCTSSHGWSSAQGEFVRWMRVFCNVTGFLN